MLQSVKIPPLLDAISSIVNCHAHFVSPDSEKATTSIGEVGSRSPGGKGGGRKGTTASGGGGRRGLLLVAGGGGGRDLDELPGSSITLSIVFGLLSAILGGGREVSIIEVLGMILR